MAGDQPRSDTIRQHLQQATRHVENAFGEACAAEEAVQLATASADWNGWDALAELLDAIGKDISHAEGVIRRFGQLVDDSDVLVAQLGQLTNTRDIARHLTNATAAIGDAVRLGQGLDSDLAHLAFRIARSLGAHDETMVSARLRRAVPELEAAVAAVLQAQQVTSEQLARAQQFG